MIRSIIAWGLTWIYMVVAGLISLPWIWITGRLNFTYALARVGLRAILALGGVRVVVSGVEHLPPEGPRLYMSNHQSNLDPPILVTHLPGEIAFLAKKELFSVPVLGAVLRVGGLIPVERANRAAAQASIALAAEKLRGGRPFLVFPEGTRSPDGQLLEFKKGPFYLAEQAAVPVVPISLAGSGACLPRGAWRIRPGKVEMRIHPPLLPPSWQSAADPRDAIAARLRARLTEGS